MDVGVGLSKGWKIFAYTVITILSIVCIVPLLYVIMISITDDASVLEYGYRLIPKKISFEAYEILLENPDSIIKAYVVTIFVTLVGTVIAMFIEIQFAYGLVRKNFHMRRKLSFYLYFTMLFSGGTVPIYILVTQTLGLRNSVWALILPYLVTPYNVFLLRTFMQSIPESLFEAAKLDGASEYQILYKVVYPLSKGGIATVTLFTLLSFWNAWYPALLYINNADLYPLQYLLHILMNKIKALNVESIAGMVVGSYQHLPEDSLRMATCVVAIGPLLIAFPFFQKYFVRGIAVGAVKG